MNHKIVLTAILSVAALTATVAPASAIVDLTTLAAFGSIGDAYFEQVNHRSTGTGVIDPFVRLQASGSEMGVNSDGPYTMDEKSGIWTHSIRVSDFGIVDRGGIPSIRWLLDINQTRESSLLSLDRLRIYTAASADYNTLDELDTFGNLVYDMGGDKVYLDYALESGSGAGDMLAWLPYSLFAPHSSEYLYLFSEFGATGGDYASNDGFEEWARVDGASTTPPIPEPATLLLLGGGLLGSAVFRRRRS